VTGGDVSTYSIYCTSKGTKLWYSILAAELNSETGESGEDIANLSSDARCGEVAGTAVMHVLYGLTKISGKRLT
jgi:hypothetical protein